MDLGISGRACIVTGASRGIGLATARLLAAEGARVLLTARGEEAVAVAAREIGERGGGEAAHLALDVTDPGAGERVVAACEERFGAVDVLVNNAGTSAARPVDQLTDDEWQEQWDLNVMGPMRLMRAVAPRMAERGWGRIVNVTSSAGKRPSLTNVAYAAGKAAQLSVSRSFAELYASRGVLVNAVAPGPVATPMWMAEGGLADQGAQLTGGSREDVLAMMRSRVPLGRFGTEEEIAATIAFLCSEGAGNVVGSAWSVDGGAVQVII